MTDETNENTQPTADPLNRRAWREQQFALMLSYKDVMRQQQRVLHETHNRLFDALYAAGLSSLEMREDDNGRMPEDLEARKIYVRKREETLNQLEFSLAEVRAAIEMAEAYREAAARLRLFIQNTTTAVRP